MFKYYDGMPTQDAMMPGASPECDAIEQLVERLETLNPLSKPLDNSIEKLSGDWVLLYASKGTVSNIFSVILVIEGSGWHSRTSLLHSQLR